MSQKPQFPQKEFRCNVCRNLQFKYEVSKDAVLIAVKCYSCNSFNTFVVNLKPLLDVLVQLKLREMEIEKKTYEKNQEHLS